jgi:hypothetical protein
MTKRAHKVIASVQRRRHWSRAEKEKLTWASLEASASVSSRGDLYVFWGDMITILWHDGGRDTPSASSAGCT